MGYEPGGGRSDRGAVGRCWGGSDDVPFVSRELGLDPALGGECDGGSTDGSDLNNLLSAHS